MFPRSVSTSDHERQSTVLFRAASAVRNLTTALACFSSAAVAEEATKPAIAAPAPSAASAVPAAKLDPSKEEIRLPALGGFEAQVVIENDVGIWTCGPIKTFPRYGCPEVFGLDDKGRIIVAWSYSGKWTPVVALDDKEWLGALADCDLDPEIPGREWYTGGKRGNLYRLGFHDDTTVDQQRVARFPAEEIHTLVGGELDGNHPGEELLVFTLKGDVYSMSKSENVLASKRIADTGGRVRQALVLPGSEFDPKNPSGAGHPWMIAALRSGRVLLLRLVGDTLEQRVVVDEAMGFGRVAIKPDWKPGEPYVVYATRDDGVILRLEGRPEDPRPATQAGGNSTGAAWKCEMIYAGPQGPRGVAAGHFSADPSIETVVIFGYSSKVEMLSRKAGEAWKAETIFEDREKGHWISTCEVDGRNSTDEIVCSGYGSRVILLSRPPGYGLSTIPAVAPKPVEVKAPTADKPTSSALRVASPASPLELRRLSPLQYRGGFDTKTALFDTLVVRDDAGRLAPGLAESWSAVEGGKAWRFVLRGNLRFHDGSRVDAEAVALHFRRTIGLPEHAWLPSLRYLVNVEAEGDRVVVFRLAVPAPLPEDLVAINPCAVQAPASIDGTGEFAKPIGSGPYRFDRITENGGLSLATGDRPALELVPFGGSKRDPLDALAAGDVDVVLDSTRTFLERESFSRLTKDARWRTWEAPGSTVVYLAFRHAGKTADAVTRLRIAASIDRAKLVESATFGHATPCATFAAPCFADWPQAKPVANPNVSTPLPLILAIDQADAEAERLATALVAQLAPGGIELVVKRESAENLATRIAGEDWDLRFDITYGLPYDPYLTLAARFLPAPKLPTATKARDPATDASLRALVQHLVACVDESAQLAIYERVQGLIDQEAVLIPLYSPNRLAVARRDIVPPKLGVDLYRLRFE